MAPEAPEPQMHVYAYQPINKSSPRNTVIQPLEQ